MPRKIGFVLSLVGILGLLFGAAGPVPACCPLGLSGKPVVNADQTVVILWDAARKTQHFIRKASFQSAADDFAFLVPTPTKPELKESGNSAFPYLQKLTEPEIKRVARPHGGMGCGCGEKTVDNAPAGLAKAEVSIVTEKMVAGFHAVVLQADSADALVGWLKENGYELSPEAEAWAKPYVEAGWMITALKVAKAEERKEDKNVAAAALRISFETDRPLFPYREPDSGASAKELGATRRLLRIYYIGEARFDGELTKEVPWSGRVAWAGKLKEHDRDQALELLGLPAGTGPDEWWLTEFEDNWAYQVAPADVYFSVAADQSTVKRPPIIEYVSSGSPPDLTAYALAIVLVVWPASRMMRRGRRT
jgi:hypothetical protein